LSVDALGSDQFAATIRRVTQRGYYLVTASTSEGATGQTTTTTRLWTQTLAVNGPSRESDLRFLDERDLRQRIGAARIHWVPPGAEIQITGGSTSGHHLWKWLMLAVLVGLLAEMILAGHRPAPQPANLKVRTTAG
jgi:hypothetical protein